MYRCVVNVILHVLPQEEVQGRAIRGAWRPGDFHHDQSIFSFGGPPLCGTMLNGCSFFSDGGLSTAS